jgi:hypothetical protein
MNLFNNNKCNTCNIRNPFDETQGSHVCNICTAHQSHNTYCQAHNIHCQAHITNHNNIHNKVQKVDPQTADKIFNNFMIEYYRNVSAIGWNVVTYLFDPACIILYRDKNIGNVFGLLNALSVDNVKRANYSNIRSKWIIPDINTMVINVFGFIQLISFNNEYGQYVPFTDTFIIKNDQNGTRCTHYILDY